MPVYEFYCKDCHRIYNFLSRAVNTEKCPACPKCGRSALERRVSLFAVSKGRTEAEEGPMPDLDEAQLEKAMMALGREAEGLDEDDPRQAARIMRKLYDATGMRIGPGMEEAMRRMEAGEDPDQIERDLGNILEEEDPFAGQTGKGLKDVQKMFQPPSVDETLYEL